MTHTWQRNELTGESWLKDVNGEAFARKSSAEVFRQTFRDSFTRGSHLYVIVGTDSALLARWIARHYCNDKRRFVFIELNDSLEQLKDHLPDAPCIEVIPADAFDLEALSERYPEYTTHNRMTLLRSLAVLDHLSPRYQALWETVLDQFKLFTHEQASLRANRKFIDTQLYNIPFNYHPVALLEKTLPDLSVIILGGGPTLDDGIDWIRKNREHIILLAVGRIARRLQMENITPDFFIAVDPNDVSYDNSKWMTVFDRPILVHTPYANSSLLAEYPGPQCFTDARYPWNTEQNPDNLITHGPTVSNTAMPIATLLGAKRIYLLGVDFCYGQSGETHESQSLESKQGALTHSADLFLETYSGRKAATNTVFFQAAEAASQFARTLHEQTDIRIYQLGQESARLEGVELVRLTDIQLNETATQRDALQTARERLAETLKARRQFLKAQLKELQEKRKAFRQVMQWGEDGKKTADQLFINMDKLDQQTHRITQLKAKLEKPKHAWISQFLYHYAIGNYAKFLAPSDHDNSEQTQEEIKENLQHYFEALHTTAESILENIDKAIEHVNNHLKELNPSYFSECASYWLTHHQEGRIHLWLKRHDSAELPQADHTLVEKLKRAYQAKLEQTEESGLVKRLQQAASTLVTHLQAATQAYEQHDTETLETVIAATASMQSPRARSLHALAQGYLEELRGRPEQALEHYVHVEEPDMQPHALNRITAIALERKDFNTVLNALELLTRYDDLYFIMYADLLLNLGDPAGAIQIYDHYLQKHREDYSVWLKAAKAALVGGDLTAARQCAETVLNDSNEETLIQQAKNLLDQINASSPCADEESFPPA